MARCEAVLQSLVDSHKGGLASMHSMLMRKAGKDHLMVKTAIRSFVERNSDNWERVADMQPEALYLQILPIVETAMQKAGGHKPVPSR
ncbi:MAG: hypothetical protein HY221_01125 [Candidatus Sungbacteria bacterium]|uniref:Uncharacterized protein n=1 Tax=Candidatus Sungiibacteriota bacterium TaxID=2750080 RepID=A0A932R0T7_9BACT|nr:hypothetical protein [Candidatus Sungbacteria bacterium]